jgi:ECF sigma factor
MIMNDVTLILSKIEQGDPCAAEELLPLVYAELRRLALRVTVYQTRQKWSYARAWLRDALKD